MNFGPGVEPGAGSRCVSRTASISRATTAHNSEILRRKSPEIGESGGNTYFKGETIVKRTTTYLHVLAAMLLIESVPSALAHDERYSCSNASLQGAYAFTVGAIVPPGTPRGILGRFVFDGNGTWTNTITMNDNGTIRKIDDRGTYTVNTDCTGELKPQTGAMGTVEIILVAGGKEFYQLRTDPPGVVFLFNSAKRQSPDKGKRR